MATPSNTVSFTSLMTNIQHKKFENVYLLMGEETYFIDQLTEALLANVLTEDEKDFNLHLFYGQDSDVDQVMAAAKRFPMMANHQLVVVKEAQKLDKLDRLDLYLQKPVPSTILVICYKYGTVDGRKSFVKRIKSMGVVFESKKLYDNQVPDFIRGYFAVRQIEIDSKSAQMLTDFVGTNIAKLIPELEKLQISLPTDAPKRITSDLVEANVGISKDYNNFELRKAIIQKDVLTANRIIDYFGSNPKDNPMIVTISVLFSYFSNLLECYWLSNKTKDAVMNLLHVKSFPAEEYMMGLRNYSAFKVMEIISLLRTYDAKSKGLDSNSNTSDSEMLRELAYKIMH